MKKKMAGIRGARVKPYFTITRFLGFLQSQINHSHCGGGNLQSCALVKALKVFAHLPCSQCAKWLAVCYPS